MKVEGAAEEGKGDPSRMNGSLCYRRTGLFIPKECFRVLKQKPREMNHEREINTVRNCQASLTSTHRIDKYQYKYRTPEYRKIVGCVRKIQSVT